MKFFFIGFNKTGTTTIDTIMNNLGYNSRHNIDWAKSSQTHVHEEIFDNYESFTDGEMADFFWLSQEFPESTFILNYRNVRDWAISRYKHVERNKAWPVRCSDWLHNSKEDIKNWIVDRNYYHKYALNNLQNDLHLLNVIDWNECKIRNAFYNITGSAESKNIPIPHENKSKNVANTTLVDEALKDLKISPDQYEHIVFDILCLG